MLRIASAEDWAWTLDSLLELLSLLLPKEKLKPKGVGSCMKAKELLGADFTGRSSGAGIMVRGWVVVMVMMVEEVLEAVGADVDVDAAAADSLCRGTLTTGDDAASKASAWGESASTRRSLGPVLMPSSNVLAPSSAACFSSCIERVMLSLRAAEVRMRELSSAVLLASSSAPMSPRCWNCVWDLLLNCFSPADVARAIKEALAESSRPDEVRDFMGRAAVFCAESMPRPPLIELADRARCPGLLLLRLVAKSLFMVVMLLLSRTSKCLRLPKSLRSRLLLLRLPLLALGAGEFLNVCCGVRVVGRLSSCTCGLDCGAAVCALGSALCGSRPELTSSLIMSIPEGAVHELLTLISVVLLANRLLALGLLKCWPLPAALALW